ncbi:MAG: hypothetical protein M3Z37_11785 [Candidatus Eremiobacteraeota bacterium]|nr:hypothetical protein [Candidatus Eremiobacteraeota bacterium]
MKTIRPVFGQIAFAFFIALCFVVLGTSTGSTDQRDFTVYNETSYTIERLYVSPHSADNWEEDVLGSDVLRPGHHVKITFSDDLGACYYDIKAIYSDKTKSIKYNVDLCSISTFRFHE